MLYNNGYGMQRDKNKNEMNNQNKGCETRTRLVIDDTTIYEIDIRCEECKRRNRFKEFE